MSTGNPDNIVSIHTNNILNSSDEIDILNLETVTEELSVGMEDEESTPVVPQPSSNDLNTSMGHLVESPNFNQTNPRVRQLIVYFWGSEKIPYCLNN